MGRRTWWFVGRTHGGGACGDEQTGLLEEGLGCGKVGHCFSVCFSRQRVKSHI